MKKPRRIFRARRSGSALYLTAQDIPMPPGIEAWAEQNRDRLARLAKGQVHSVEVWHDADCRYPQGGQPCTCRKGPEIRLAGEDPEAN